MGNRGGRRGRRRGRDGGVGGERERETDRHREKGFITGFNSLAQPVLRYVLLTPFWQMDENINPFLSSSSPTTILQFKADL